MSSDPLFWALGEAALERPFESANPYIWLAAPANEEPAALDACAYRPA